MGIVLVLVLDCHEISTCILTSYDILISSYKSLTAEAKRKAAAEAAAAKREEQKRLAEEKKAAAAAEAAAKKKQEAETKRAAAQAQKSVQKAAPGATINIFGGFGGGGGSKPAPAPAQVEAAKAAAASAPRGVPTISSWKQNRDGSISGFISGSPSFDDGESVTTSPIKGEASDGAVVQTGSGSKYFLAPQSQKKSTTFSLFGGGGGGGGAKVAPAPAPAPAKSAPAGPSPAALAAQARKEQQAKLAEERKAAAEARKAEGKSSDG